MAIAKSIEQEAEDLERAGQLKEALVKREQCLTHLQRIFGDPSFEADNQKLLMCELIVHITWAASGTGAFKTHSGGPQKDEDSTQVKKESSSKPASKKFDSVCASLNNQGLVAFAERLLGPGNTLPETQLDHRVITVRGKLLLTLGAALHANKRPRAAIPFVQRALVLFRQSAQQQQALVTLDVATSLLTMSALQSASHHHEEGLRCASEALETVLQLEELFWANDPESIPATKQTGADQQQSKNAPSNSNVGGEGRSGADSGLQDRRARSSMRDPYGDGDDEDYDEIPSLYYDGDDQYYQSTVPSRGPSSPNQENTAQSTPRQARDAGQTSSADQGPKPREKTYFGELQAACYFNMGTEQEHLGLFELALESFQSGFQVAFECCGPQHPLSQKLKRSYAEVFASLHFRHFTSAASGKAAKQLFNLQPEAAVKSLNNTYKKSVVHQEALRHEVLRQHRLLSRALPANSTATYSNTQFDVSVKLQRESPSTSTLKGARPRPGSAMSAASNERPRSATLHPGGRVRPQSALKRSNAGVELATTVYRPPLQF